MAKARQAEQTHHDRWDQRSSPAVVAAELRRAIMRGELLAGEQIRQIEWAQRLGVSQVPIREALKTLAAEGILTHGHNRGYFVARFGSAEVGEIYMMRRVLERELLRTIGWPDRRELAGLRTLADRLRDRLLKGDMRGWAELDRRFLAEVHALSIATILPAELDRLWLLSNIYRGIVGWPTTNMDAAVQFYQEVVAALADKDRARLMEVFDAQLARAQAGHIESWRQREAAYSRANRSARRATLQQSDSLM